MCLLVRRAVSDQHLRRLEKYLDSLGNAIETGVREALSHPQTRTQFDQVVGQTLRVDLLLQAGINPMSPVKFRSLRPPFAGLTTS